MVDAGEKCTDALKREFSEEALNSKEATPEQLEKLRKLVEEFFASGTQVYSGYVDDPRNTDNAWMETVAVNFHDETGDRIARFDLRAGDDAKKVCWMDVSSDIKLYASHRDFLQLAAKLRDARW
ncbi:putative ADP-ribose pyrophosphatase mitochondrial [Paragonimus kellicotti]|nr:putative ADP-ribose pyrophosphatase mitochondrial [Paragonimus kellicotti]